MKYNPALDGLRGVSIALVVACHTGVTGFAGGSRGVDVFFVLSGYLITTIIKADLEAGTFSKVRFWLRRARRLLPALIAMLIAFVALAPSLVAPEFAETRWIDAAAAFFYVTDYTTAIWHPSMPLTVTWSLSIEEQFYALWPFVVPLLVKLRRPALWLLIAWVALTWLRLGAVLLATDGLMAYRWGYFTLHGHSSGLLLGAALAFAPSFPRWGWLGAVLVGVCVIPASWASALLWSIPGAELGAALMIAGAVQAGWIAKVMAIEPLRWLGLVSYGVYLWHPFVQLALDHRSIGGFGPTMTISILLATLSYWTVERAFHRRPGLSTQS